MNAVTAPTASPIAGLRTARRFLRGVALLVTVAFTMLVLAPTAAVAREELERRQQDTVLAATDEADLSRTLQRIETRLARFAHKLERRLDAGADAEDLKRLRRDVERLDGKIQNRFEKIERRLRERGLAPVILERHRAVVATYRAELGALLANLDAVEQAPDDETRAERLQRARARLGATKHQRSQQPFDANDLPTRALRPDPQNEPGTDRDAFRQSGLFDTPYAKLAALGDYRLDGLPGAEDPAFLAASDEVVLTGAIADKAAELGHDPVAIYRWVRNTIQWQPGWGAVQDAELTLHAGRGNAMDIASLTIALLRASGIPARYLHGTIEVPEERFRNWVGGFASIDAAVDYAASGGIPVTTVVSSGRIAKIRLEHVWVEAAIDFHPSRGGKNYAADTWVDLDPSFKQYEYVMGLDAIAIGEIDPAQLAQEFLDSGTVAETEGWVGGFDPAILEDAQQQAQTRLEQYLADNFADPTVGDLIGGRKTIVQEFPVLPSALANRIVAVGATYDRLPPALQQRIAWSFGAYGTPVSFPWSRVNNRKLTLSFRPAAEADEQALQSLLPEGEIADLGQLPASIPAYLIHVVPELKLDGEAVVAGAAMALGEELDLITRVTYPTLEVPARTQTLIAGSYLVVNAVAANVSAPALEALRDRLQATKDVLETQDPVALAGLTRQELLGDLFHAGGLGYYAQLIGLAHIAGLQAGGHFRLGAGLGTIGYEPQVSYFFGIPRAIEPGGVALDIPLQFVSAVDGTDPERHRQFNLQLGVISSALEHAVPEQMFATPEQPADAISAVKALQKANAQGQRIYHITPENRNAALPNIGHDAATMDEIRAALAVGKEVITHTGPVSVPGWSGAGYVIIDPETGVGAWKIGGGANGSFLRSVDSKIKFVVSVIEKLPGPLKIALKGLFVATIIVGYDFIRSCFGKPGLGPAVAVAVVSSILIGALQSFFAAVTGLGILANIVFGALQLEAINAVKPLCEIKV